LSRNSKIGVLGRVGSVPRVKVLVGIIIGLGIIARVAQYLANRSLWFDEAMLALNIVHRSFGGLLQSLNNSQTAPIGFLMLEKLAIQIFGANEYALRVVPLLAGILSLPLCYLVAKQFISPAAVPIALGLVTILDPLVYYSSEVKQYSSDVAIALFLLWVAMKAEQDGWQSRWLLVFTVVGAISVWFSYPAVFVLAGMGGVLIIAHLRGNRIGIAVSLSVAFVIAALSFAVFYFLFVRNIASNRHLRDYWSSGFMPFPPAFLSQARWIRDTFLEIFNYPVTVGSSGLGAFLFLVGGIVMFIYARQRFFVLASSILLTLVASALHLYPFRERLILFLVPVFLLLIAEGMVRLAGQTHQMTVLIGMVAFALIFFQPVVSFGKAITRPRHREEIKPVLDYISRYHEDQDVIYVYYGGKPAFEFYAPSYNLRHNILFGVKSRDAPEKYSHDLERLRGQMRVWVLFTHIYNWGKTDEEAIFLNNLDRMGARRASFRSPGAVCYLYDLSELK
jgi:hypothetical protein